MDHRVGVAQGFGQAGDVRQVVLDQLDADLGEVERPARLADQGNDRVPALAKVADDRASDEPAAAGDDDPERAQ